LLCSTSTINLWSTNCNRMLCAHQNAVSYFPADCWECLAHPQLKTVISQSNFHVSHQWRTLNWKSCDMIWRNLQCYRAITPFSNEICPRVELDFNATFLGWVLISNLFYDIT
jgi:hypothetical protein